MFQILLCPACHTSLLKAEQNMQCPHCSKKYPISQNVIDTLPIELSSDKAKVISGYHLASQMLEKTGVSQLSKFMNLGYIADHNPQQAVIGPEKNRLNQNSEKLLFEVIGSYPVDGKTILEVGCGRGGNIQALQHYFAPHLLYGLDICMSNIEACKALQNSFTAFIIGDAEQLPFSDCSFDMILNIESSDAYPDIMRFYQQVYRVLRNGGSFLYADMYTREQFEENTEKLKKTGFKIIRNTNITSNVILSCYHRSKKRSAAYGKQSGRQQQELSEFLAVPGSKVFDEMANETKIYKIIQMEKP